MCEDKAQLSHIYPQEIRALCNHSQRFHLNTYFKQYFLLIHIKLDFDRLILKNEQQMTINLVW